MEAMMTLTIKQTKFLYKYLESGCATSSYRNAYNTERMKPETINRCAHELLHHPKVSTRIDKLKRQEQERLRKKYKLHNDRIIQEYFRLALFDIRQLFDAAGKLKLPQDLDPDTAAALASIEVVSKTSFGGELEYVHKYKMVDKRGPLQDVAKMLGMFEKDNIQQHQNTTIKVETKYELPDHLKKGYPGMVKKDDKGK